MTEIILKVQEHHLELKADLLALKIIAEAIGSYMDTHQLENKTLSDFRFNMEVEYQRRNALDEDDWDYTEADKEELAIHERKRWREGDGEVWVYKRGRV
jgi:hypothetical protein